MTQPPQILAGETEHPRDFRGYGAAPPDPRWPGGARLALSFVLNYEEGAENTVLNGDAGSELYLHEVPGGTPRPERDLSTESQFDYGARAGVWRVLRMFAERNLPLTIYAVGRALELNPEVGAAFAAAGHEVASHGWRWIDYRTMPEAQERTEIARCVEVIQRIAGQRPVGWYTGRISLRTRRLVAEHGGFLYDSDSYADDLPYYVQAAGKPLLVVPYTLDNNDMKFAVPPGFTAPDGFTQYLTDAFDTLYREGGRMMSVGLHCRLVGRPGRAAALARFLDHVAKHKDVWVCRRAEIARHWLATHPPQAG
ncbi:allantoinase PuuE [Siccirubricoccus sp. KC 17139]|uniref:Chitooligosaccharide deacetylase n=1 Tax=Siccirubricoccus soli TaxID=2899147 RepID=A0ABT1D5H6_9PROT|nr:allantoinase PuuE [Siccirubricoccus soli]MCO6417151.1 allantoinase PuuE [Siccirubricoccus soli]MCP2683286.1 allantoinase PuuE [Siccirubricoccus soli]